MKFPETAATISKAISEAGLTQSEIAKKAGVTRGLISQYVTGRTRPSYEVAQKLSEALDLSFDALISCDREGGGAISANAIERCMKDSDLKARLTAYAELLLKAEGR